MLADSLPDLDYQNLVNWEDPLNHGRLVWYLNLPQWRGGITVRDIAQHNHGTWNVGAGDSIPGKWVGPRGRPGGWGSLQGDGSNDVVTASVAVAFPFSVSFWVRATGNVATDYNNKGLCGRWGGSQNEWIVWTTANSGDFDVQLLAGGLTLTTTATRNNDWHHLGCTFDPSGRARLYLKGRLLEASGGTGSFTVGDAPFRMFAYSSGDFSCAAVQLDDMSLWTRALSDAEVGELYSQSRCGYPDLLNRYRPVTYSVPAAAPSGFQPAWAVGANSWIGTGVA